MRIDVRSILPTVRVPTLVLHRATDEQVSVKFGRDMALQIPGANYIEYPDGHHVYFTGDVEALHGDIEEFITGHRESHAVDLERILATVLFTDIVNSTRSAAEMGDRRSVGCWTATINWPNRWSRNIEAIWSSRLGTAFSRLSTDRAAAFAVPWR